MSTTQPKAVIQQLVDGFWNQGDESVLDQLFAENMQDHNVRPGVPAGRVGLKQTITGVRAAFTDSHLSLEDAVVDGGKIAWRWTFSGTHTGVLMGIPATGKQIAFSGITIDRIANGQIVERWAQIDMLGMMQQLGVIPSAG